MDDMQSAPYEASQVTRRGFAALAASALVALGGGALSLRNAAAREAEPGDDRGGHGRHDRRRHRRREDHHRHGRRHH